jgi:hypothetical protein
VLCNALAACAVGAPGVVSSTGSGIAAGAAIELVSNADQPARNADFHDALGRAFERRSIEVRANSPYIADYALATHRANVGLAAKPSGTGEGDEPDWQEEPRKGSLFDECKAYRMRATLTVFRRSSGEMVYRGTREAEACSFGKDDIVAAADDLVADVMARAGA